MKCQSKLSTSSLISLVSCLSCKKLIGIANSCLCTYSYADDPELTFAEVTPAPTASTGKLVQFLR